MIPAEVQHADVGYLLPRQRPVALAQESERDAHGARGEQCHAADDCHLTVHHVLRHVTAVRYAQGGYDKGEEHHPRHFDKAGLAEEGGDEGGAEEEDGIHQRRHEDVEGEDGVVVATRGMLYIYQPLREARALQVAGYGGEDGQHTHYAIVGIGEHTRQTHADDKVQHLRAAAV